MRNEQLKYCKECVNRKLDFQRGVVCAITDQYAAFEGICSHYEKETIEQKPAVVRANKEAHRGGKKIIIILSILLSFSILSTLASITLSRFIGSSFIIGFIQVILFIILFNAVYEGKEWGRVTLTILLAINIIRSLSNIAGLIEYSPLFLLLLIMPLFHGYIIYFLYANKDYQAYLNYKRTRR